MRFSYSSHVFATSVPSQVACETQRRRPMDIASRQPTRLLAAQMKKANAGETSHPSRTLPSPANYSVHPHIPRSTSARRISHQQRSSRINTASPRQYRSRKSTRYIPTLPKASLRCIFEHTVFHKQACVLSSYSASRRRAALLVYSAAGHA